MPRKSRKFRSNRYALSLALAGVLSTASIGCRSTIPEPVAWEPRPIVFSETSMREGATDRTTVSVASEQSPVVDATASSVAFAAGMVTPASHLRPAEPLAIQPPEEIETPAPESMNEAEDVPAPKAESANDGGMAASGFEVPPLMLEDVVASVRNTYPKIREAVARRDEASGQIVSSLGSFDTVLDAHSLNQPVGFYETYRHGIGLKKPLWNGGYVGAGYRIGDGNFEPWYGERETDEGGEFKLGIDVPLLQGRDIDKRRTALRTAQLRRAQTEPELFLEILNTQGDASVAYWTWIASGLNVEVQRALLKLGQDRVEQINRQIELKDVPEFRRIDNDRLIASREIKLIDAQRKFEQSAVKLSIYFRDAAGSTIVPPPAALPEDFPIASEEPADVMRYVDSAIASRPETRIFQFDLASLQVELAQATNQLLPELNLALETSQDVGEQASSKGDKSPNKIEAGIYGEVPLQRRGARGKIDSLNAKMRQVQAKLQLASDMIANEVQQIIVARDASQRQIKQAETNLKLANEALRLGTIGLREGEFTLPILNIYEQAVADAEAALLVAKAEFFIADSLLRIASGQELDSN